MTGISIENRPQDVEAFASRIQYGKTIDALFDDAAEKQKELVDAVIKALLSYVRKQHPGVLPDNAEASIFQAASPSETFNHMMESQDMNLRIIDPGSKDKARAQEKCLQRQWQPHELTDILRVSVTTDDPDIHEYLQNALTMEFPLFTEPEWTLRAVGMLRRSMRCAVDGVVGQITVYDPHHKKANELGHIIYEVLREYDYLHAEGCVNPEETREHIIHKYNDLCGMIQSIKKGEDVTIGTWNQADKTGLRTFLQQMEQKNRFSPEPITANITDAQMKKAFISLIPLYQLIFASFIGKASPAWQNIYEQSYAKLAQTPVMKLPHMAHFKDMLSAKGLNTNVNRGENVGLFRS